MWQNSRSTWEQAASKNLPKFDTKLWVVFAIQPIGFPTEVLWCSLECTPPCQGGGREFKSRQDRFTQSKLNEA